MANIVSDADDYAREVAAAFGKAGISVRLDLGREKINAKIREHSVQHVPVIGVVGRKEAETRSVALRRLGGEAQEVMSLDEAVARLTRGRRLRMSCATPRRPECSVYGRAALEPVHSDAIRHIALAARLRCEALTRLTRNIHRRAP